MNVSNVATKEAATFVKYTRTLCYLLGREFLFWQSFEVGPVCCYLQFLWRINISFLFLLHFYCPCLEVSCYLRHFRNTKRGFENKKKYIYPKYVPVKQVTLWLALPTGTFTEDLQWKLTMRGPGQPNNPTMTTDNQNASEYTATSVVVHWAVIYRGFTSHMSANKLLTYCLAPCPTICGCRD